MQFILPGTKVREGDPSGSNISGLQVPPTPFHKGDQLGSQASAEPILESSRISESDSLLMPAFVNQNEIGLCRSSCTRKRNFGVSTFFTIFFTTDNVHTIEKLTLKKDLQFTTKNSIDLLDNLDCLVEGTINSMSPLLQVFGTVTDNETYMYKAVMEKPDF